MSIFRWALAQCRKQRKGSPAFEWIILFPLMFLMTIGAIWLLLLFMCYVSFNNLATTMAQDLNMRQSGYEDRISAGNSATVQIDGGAARGTETINVTAATSEMTLAVNNLVNANKGRFEMPYCYNFNIEANTYKGAAGGVPIPSTNFNDIRMSGGIIQVVIHYTFGGVRMDANGYSVIA